MAELNGRRLSDELNELDAPATCVMLSHAAVMAKAAELHGTVAIAASDHSFTPTEAALADRKAADTINSLHEFRQSLAKVRAGEIPPELPNGDTPKT